MTETASVRQNGERTIRINTTTNITRHQMISDWGRIHTAHINFRNIRNSNLTTRPYDLVNLRTAWPSGGFLGGLPSSLFGCLPLRGLDARWDTGTRCRGTCCRIRALRCILNDSYSSILYNSNFKNRSKFGQHWVKLWYKRKNWCHHSESDSEDSLSELLSSASSVPILITTASCRSSITPSACRKSLSIPSTWSHAFDQLSGMTWSSAVCTCPWTAAIVKGPVLVFPTSPFTCAHINSMGFSSQWPTGKRDRRRSVILLGVQSSYPWRAIWRRYGQIPV